MAEFNRCLRKRTAAGSWKIPYVTDRIRIKNAGIAVTSLVTLIGPDFYVIISLDPGEIWEENVPVEQVNVGSGAEYHEIHALRR